MSFSRLISHIAARASVQEKLRVRGDRLRPGESAPAASTRSRSTGDSDQPEVSQI